MSGAISRLTLPENFYDVTSDKLLMQPEPQYLHAQLWMRAMRASLQVPAMFGLALPDRQVGGTGAPYRAVDADRLQLAGQLFDSIIGAKFDMTGAPGSTVFVNRPKFSNTTYTRASRLVMQNQSISTTPIGVGSEQVPLTLQRFAGPYDQANSRVAPYGFDAFDSKMGVHNAAEIGGNNLARDFHRFVDYVMIALGDTGSTVVRPAGMTTDDTPGAVGSYPLDYDTLCRAEEQADTNNLPTMADGYRLFVTTPTGKRQVRNDAQYVRSAEFHPEFNVLFPGYFGTVNRMHMFQSTTLSVVANSNSVPTNVHRSQLFCPAAYGCAMGGQPKVLSSTDDNYGLTPKVIWVCNADWVLTDNRFVISVRHSA